MVAKFHISHRGDQWSKSMTGIELRMAKASTKTIHEAGMLARDQGRANIASAGFPRQWQTGLRVSFIPRGNRPAINSSAKVFHRFGFANVFETGKVISPKRSKFLWIPIAKNLPRLRGGGNWTPAKYIRLIGPLVSLRGRGGKAPLLAGRQIHRSTGQFTGGVVPLFVGIATASIRKRFDIVKIVNAVRARLGELYAKNIKLVK